MSAGLLAFLVALPLQLLHHAEGVLVNYRQGQDYPLAQVYGEPVLGIVLHEVRGIRYLQRLPPGAQVLVVQYPPQGCILRVILHVGCDIEVGFFKHHDAVLHQGLQEERAPVEVA